MSLLDRCETIQSKRKRLANLQKGSQQTLLLQDKYLELSEKINLLPGAVALYQLYLDQAIPFTPVPVTQIQTLRNTLHAIKQRFEIKSAHSSLVKDKDWPKFMEQFERVNEDIRENCQQGWVKFTQSYFEGHTPQTLENCIIRTEENLRLLEKFKNLYRELRILASAGQKKESIQNFKTKGKLLLEIAQKLNDFEAPEGVQQFLTAVNEGGASLELLTVEVIEWLKEQDLFTKFKVLGGD